MSEAYNKYKELDKVLDEYSGGAVPYKHVAFFEKIKPSDPTLYHVKNYGKVKVLIMLIETK